MCIRDRRLEDELHNIRNEPKEMMDKMRRVMATMMRSQGQREQKESGGAEESATVMKRPEGVSPASRAENS